MSGASFGYLMILSFGLRDRLWRFAAKIAREVMLHCNATSLFGPSKNITILIQELQEIRLFFRAHLGSDPHGSVWYSGVECHSGQITSSFDCFLELC
jgi:hypothetical protein